VRANGPQSAAAAAAAAVRKERLLHCQEAFFLEADVLPLCFRVICPPRGMACGDREASLAARSAHVFHLARAVGPLRDVVPRAGPRLAAA
jgi:hypothetical protein